jgi:hypothetical protein
MMDSRKINDWLQVIGTFGVIASLLFVGLQMRQTQDIALANTYSTRAAISAEAHSSSMGSPQHFSARAKVYSGLRDQLTAEEYVALEHDLSSNLTMIENNFFQYEMGFLPEGHWRKNLVDLDCWMSEPFFVSLGEEWPAHEDFRPIIDAAIERGRKAANSCWENPADDPWPYFNPVE